MICICCVRVFPVLRADSGYVCFDCKVEYLATLLRIQGFLGSKPSEKSDVVNQCLCDLSSGLAEYVKTDNSYQYCDTSAND